MTKSCEKDTILIPSDIQNMASEIEQAVIKDVTYKLNTLLDQSHTFQENLAKVIASILEHIVTNLEDNDINSKSTNQISKAINQRDLFDYFNKMVCEYHHNLSENKFENRGVSRNDFL